MKKYTRIFPIWFIPFLVLAAFSLMQCGCKAGGSWIGSGSAGTVIVPQTPQQTNERNKPRLEPPTRPTGTAPLTHSARTAPSTTEAMKSAEADPVHIDPKPAGTPKSFSPTVSVTAKNVKLFTPKAKPLPTKKIEGDGGCVIITDERVNPRPLPPTPPKEETNTPNNQANTGVKPNSDMSIDWVRLIMFYVIGFLIIAFAYVSWDIFKTYKKTPVGKKPAKKRTSRKGTPKKKAPRN
jgi:hypothetical protein